MQISKTSARSSGERHPLELSPAAQQRLMRTVLGEQQRRPHQFAVWPTTPIPIAPTDFGPLLAVPPHVVDLVAPSALRMAETDSDDELLSVADEDVRVDAESEGEEDTAVATKRKTRFHFTKDADVTMFREIMGEDGLFVEDGCSQAQRWQRVYTALNLDGIDCTLPSMKNRVTLKVNQYKASQAKSKRGSGVSEPPESELDKLIREYIEGSNELALEKASKRKEKDSKEAEEARRGRAIRDAATDRLVKGEALDGKKRVDGPQALKEYVDLQSKEIEYKKQKLEVNAEERRRDHEERREEREHVRALQQQSLDMQERMIEKQDQ